jgi:hypothetical protein
MKKATISALIASSVWCAPAFATGIPGTDYAALGNNIINTLEAMFRHAEKTELSSAGMQQLGDIAGVMVDGENNAWANATIRENNHEQELQNLKLKQDLQPGSNSCELVTMSSLLNTELCDFGADVLEMDNARENGVHSNVPAEQKHMSSATRATLNSIEILNRAKLKRPDLLDDSITTREKDLLQADIDKTDFIVTNPIMLVSSSSLMLTLTEEEKNTLVDFANLVSPVNTLSKTEESIYDVSDEAKIDFAVKQAFSSISSNTFQQLITFRTPLTDAAGAPSMLEVMQRFSDENYATDNNVKDSVLYKASTSNLVTPASIARNNLTISAFRAHLKTEKYKRSLNSELIYTALLARKLNH